MGGLREIGARLPPGFRFYPSDEELVCHYLSTKVKDKTATADGRKNATLLEIDLHTCEPWQLPEVAKLNNTEWYFFSFRDRKYATGYRTNRATQYGYWKATGKDRVILDPRSGEIVGMRKTLVFYQNRAPNGMKTGWIMHEFRLECPNMPPKEDWVLCRVLNKSKEDGNSTANTNNEQMMLDNDQPRQINYTSNSTMAMSNNWASSSSLCEKEGGLDPFATSLNSVFQNENENNDLVILKEQQGISLSNTFSSCSDLMTSNAMNLNGVHDYYGFNFWDMDTDNYINNAAVVPADDVLINSPIFPSPLL